MAVIRVFVPVSTGEKNLWKHSIQVAITSRLIAKALPKLEIDPEMAYLYGLLHDLGRFVLFDVAPKELERVDDTHWNSPKQLVDTEHELYGFDHAELGRRVCKHWGLPDAILATVSQHHKNQAFKPPMLNSKIDHLVRIVQLADSLSVYLMNYPITKGNETSAAIDPLSAIFNPPSKALMSINTLTKFIPEVVAESDRLSKDLGIQIR